MFEGDIIPHVFEGIIYAHGLSYQNQLPCQRWNPITLDKTASQTLNRCREGKFGIPIDQMEVWDLQTVWVWDLPKPSSEERPNTNDNSVKTFGSGPKLTDLFCVWSRPLQGTMLARYRG